MKASDYQEGEFVKLAQLKRYHMLENPYAFIKEHGECIGITDLPKDLFSEEFCFPSVNEENIWTRSAAVESLLQQHGIDISITSTFLRTTKSPQHHSKH